MSSPTKSPDIRKSEFTLRARNLPALVFGSLATVATAMPSPASAAPSYGLAVSDGRKYGSFERVDHPEAGPLMIQRGQVGASLQWTVPDNVPKGWYAIQFMATHRFQVLAQWLDENDPFRLVVQKPGYDEESCFAYKEPGGSPVVVSGLPEPLLDPTPLSLWRSSQPLAIEPGMTLSIEVRRPLLVVGPPDLVPIERQAAVSTRLDAPEDTPYHMFTDAQPVRFHYRVTNHGDDRFIGNLRLIATDAVTGRTASREMALQLPADGETAGMVQWTPPYGAYRLALETLAADDQLLSRVQRDLTYGPAIDPLALPHTWPIAFHRHPRHPIQMPPIGVKWFRAWVGWSDLEPEPGVYDWTKMDEMVELAERDGYLVLWCCHGIPLWALDESIRWNKRAFASYPPRDPELMRPFLEAFWRRYAPEGRSSVIAAVEIGNEPNAKPQAWTPQAYANYGRVVSEVTRQMTDGVPLVGISMSGGLHLGYMRDALEAGLKDQMDIASLHLYEIQNPVGQRSIERKTLAFKEVLEDFELDVPVWNTESGSPTDIRQDGVMLTQEQLNDHIRRHPDFDPSMAWRIGRWWRGASEMLGTAWMIRATCQQFVLGVDKNFFFQWSAGPHHSWVQDSIDERGNPMPKVKVVATAVLSDLLLRYGPKPTQQQPEVISGDDAWLVFAHRFAGPQGRMTAVYVHPSDLDAGSGDGVAALATGDHTASTVDHRSPWLRSEPPEPICVQVPVQSDEVWLVDMLGRERRRLEVRDGHIQFKAFEVPQYVLETTTPPAAAPSWAAPLFVLPANEDKQP